MKVFFDERVKCGTARH